MKILKTLLVFIVGAVLYFLFGLILVKIRGVDFKYSFNLLYMIMPAISFSLLLVTPAYLLFSSGKFFIKALAVLGLLLFLGSAYMGIEYYSSSRTYFSSPSRAQDYAYGDYGTELRKNDYNTLVFSIYNIPSGFLILLVNPG